MKRSRIVTLLLFLPLLVLATPAASATAATGALEAGSAMLVAKGAAVRVEFTATCPAGELAVLSATITQAAGNRIAKGTGGTVIACTGEAQDVSVLVVADVNGRRFRQGVAQLTASLIFGCCTSVPTDEVIRIRR